ncbi:somatostatin receptor type 4-like [Saccoglossus kowalevskii]|uniref:Somatostatin receptor type 4-like n=1 Tax=Saccoglossus kowalevskii TaxID=10224 RepID=A0ABM0M765_SACKO|nr:PREDICTED: somatostatin receptor type 4-like [Saccoglossus kowalevskii]
MADVASNMSLLNSTFTPNEEDTGRNSACGADPVVFFALGIFLGTVGLIGNLSFMFVVIRVKFMQTVTNHYLINLAAADLVYLLVLWILYVCLLVTDNSCVLMVNPNVRCMVGTLADIAVLTSTFCVGFISIERYVAITHPFRARQICTKGKTLFFNILMWIMSAVIKIPSALVCYVEAPASVYVAIYIIFIVVCLISICTVAILYSLTAYHFKKASKAMRDVVANSSRQAPSHDKQVVRICVSTTVLYFICLFPKELVFILQLILQFGEIEPPPWSVCLHNISILPLMVHSAANPIIYNVMSTKYRRAFRIALLSCKDKTKLRGDKTFYSRTNNYATERSSCNTRASPRVNQRNVIYNKKDSLSDTLPRTTSI